MLRRMITYISANVLQRHALSTLLVAEYLDRIHCLQWRIAEREDDPDQEDEGHRGTSGHSILVFVVYRCAGRHDCPNACETGTD